MNYVQVLHHENHMGTTFELCISCSKENAKRAQRVLQFCHRLIFELESELSEFLQSSPIYRLNHALPYERIRLPASAMDLLQRSEMYRVFTDGYFDCTAKSRGQFNGSRFEFCPSSSSAWRVDSDATMGFGAIGKGFALDQIRMEIENEGFHDFVISAGGSSTIISGFAGPRLPWKWGWSWKKDLLGSSLGIPYLHQSGKCIALGVSGIHEKGAHLIDPHVESCNQASSYRQQSLLVAHPSATEADAISTAAFVAGWEKAQDWVKKSLIPYAMAMVGLSGEIQWNGCFENFWGDSRVSWKQSISPI